MYFIRTKTICTTLFFRPEALIFLTYNKYNLQLVSCDGVSVLCIRKCIRANIVQLQSISLLCNNRLGQIAEFSRTKATNPKISSFVASTSIRCRRTLSVLGTDNSGISDKYLKMLIRVFREFSVQPR